MGFALLPLTGLAAGCAAGLVAVIAVCSVVIGGTRRSVVEDVFMVALTEVSARLALRSPLDFVRLHGAAQQTWSLVLGTSLAMVGILLNHLASEFSA